MPQSEHERRRYVPPPVDSSKVVPKPVSDEQASNPREFQLRQLRRRFSPSEEIGKDGTSLAFKLVPSDPEFPFDMPFLDCVLCVPNSYPGMKGSAPTLQVRNKEMGKGYQINVEKGFDALVLRSPDMTLLGLMNALDRQLEALLSVQKAETIKLVANVRKTSGRESKTAPVHVDSVFKAALTNPAPTRSVEPVHSPEQRAAASARRETETRQLEARLGRLPLFHRSMDGIAYTLPIDPRRRDELPVSLQSIKTTRLFVPLLYPILPCRISLQGVARDAATSTEKAFEKRAKENPEVSLMAQINYLATNMHLFATEEPAGEILEEDHGIDLESLELHDDEEEDQRVTQGRRIGDDAEERNHIHLIPRPPEWSVETEEDPDSEPYDSEEFDDETAEEEDDHQADESVSGPERGVALSFPLLEMYGIELLELTSLCISVKCGRCKDTLDVSNLRHSEAVGAMAGSRGQRTESCKKCASPMSMDETAYAKPCINDALLIRALVGYRKELMHANSVRAGYLDLEGCTVSDLLPR